MTLPTLPGTTPRCLGGARPGGAHSQAAGPAPEATGGHVGPETQEAGTPLPFSSLSPPEWMEPTVPVGGSGSKADGVFETTGEMSPIVVPSRPRKYRLEPPCE